MKGRRIQGPFYDQEIKKREKGVEGERGHVMVSAPRASYFRERGERERETGQVNLVSIFSPIPPSSVPSLWPSLLILSSLLNNKVDEEKCC